MNTLNFMEGKSLRSNYGRIQHSVPFGVSTIVMLFRTTTIISNLSSVQKFSGPIVWKHNLVIVGRWCRKWHASITECVFSKEDFVRCSFMNYKNFHKSLHLFLKFLIFCKSLQLSPFFCSALASSITVFFQVELGLRLIHNFGFCKVWPIQCRHFICLITTTSKSSFLR